MINWTSGGPISTALMRGSRSACRNSFRTITLMRSHMTQATFSLIFLTATANSTAA